MIHIKNKHEIHHMQEGGALLAHIIQGAVARVAVGVSTLALDEFIKKEIERVGATSSFLGYGGFPAVSCISINEEIVHGLPSTRVVKDGDLITIDVGILYKGFHTDSAVTVVAGSSTPEKDSLLAVTSASLQEGIRQAHVGNTLGDLGYAIQSYIESHGMGVVRDLVGHGIGKKLHEEPQVLNFGKPKTGIKLQEGMVIAIEPMVTLGDWHTVEGKDGVFRTVDKSLSAHFEHTVAITAEGPLVLTRSARL